MGTYIVVEVKSAGQNAGHVEISGPLDISKGVSVKTTAASPNGWDALGTGDVITLKPSGASFKFRINWDDVTFMNQWQIKLATTSGNISDFQISVSANISIISADIQTRYLYKNGRFIPEKDSSHSGQRRKARSTKTSRSRTGTRTKA